MYNETRGSLIKLLGVKVIPRVSSLLSLDVYRDGGSLSVLFSDHNGTQHELMFEVLHIEDQKDPIKKYKLAKINSFIKSEYISPVTGVSIENTDIVEIKITWQQAAQLLNELLPFTEGFKSEYFWVFKCMLTICQNDKLEIKYS